MDAKYFDVYSKRAAEMIADMSLTEKISQLRHHSKSLEKHKIPSYNWWNECLHGVARAGVATVFPQAIALGATFSDEIAYKTADIISTEARAKHHEAVRNGDRGIYKGLTFWSPNINIYRDPRWGRGQETYGEDPVLTSLIGGAFIRGLQGDDEKYLKTSACVKHFAVHSGPEAERHTMDIKVCPKDLNETYLFAFGRAVTRYGATGVMAAYNSVNGHSLCADETFIGGVLRDKWHFKGYVVSDCGGVYDVLFKHKRTYNPLKAVALALNGGLDLECGTFFSLLPFAVKLGYVDEKTVDRALIRLLTIRIALGMFDDDCKYNDIPYSANATRENEEYAVEVARKACVLLKNDGILPLDKNEKVALLGYNADNKFAYLGNYYGEPTSFQTMKDVFLERQKDNVNYSVGYDFKNDKKLLRRALEAAKDCDVVVIATGLDSTLEGEAGDAGAGGDGIIGKQGDRESIALPKNQVELIDELHRNGKKIVLCNFSGGAVSFTNVENKVGAILQCWYIGAKGGAAIYDILYGLTSPSGKLPVTFYKSVDDLPAFTDYDMKNRTYRYFDGEVEYPFGYGLSYTEFAYSDLKISENAVKVIITNIGGYDADEVAEVYVKYLDDVSQPKVKLIAAKRVHIKKGESAVVEIEIDRENYLGFDDDGNFVVVDGRYRIFVGGGMPDYAATVSQTVTKNDVGLE